MSTRRVGHKEHKDKRYGEEFGAASQRNGITNLATSMTRSLLLARNAVLEAPPPVLTRGKTSRIAFPGWSLGTRKVGIYSHYLLCIAHY
ncbi:MAG: hypothetical protein IGS49_14095 [Chlorogloeopsis fritschii C42_A2020_084]|uniref:hypothetical protein n=1 Tax=Chlorogloeopsis fritschii TaxID=1124 RepID=UPI0019DE2632|nr:hypothetical protein [Chlorogloeopsis fritschii]MBF2006557.1 hypothetical protein [Chlorogloeopsis fritschii C42_A2020_084]